jgi:hypothetical protein
MIEFWNPMKAKRTIVIALAFLVVGIGVAVVAWPRDKYSEVCELRETSSAKASDLAKATQARIAQLKERIGQEKVVAEDTVKRYTPTIAGRSVWNQPMGPESASALLLGQTHAPFSLNRSSLRFFTSSSVTRSFKRANSASDDCARDSDPLADLEVFTEGGSSVRLLEAFAAKPAPRTEPPIPPIMPPIPAPIGIAKKSPTTCAPTSSAISGKCCPRTSCVLS